MTGIVVDTSALIAIALREPSRPWLQVVLEAHAGRAVIAATNVVELGIVLCARNPDSPGFVHRLIRDAELEVVAFDVDLAERAVDAWIRFGKGRHPAGLNFGDCMTYSLAEERGVPILCTGDDFARTDLEVLCPPKT